MLSPNEQQQTPRREATADTLGAQNSYFVSARLLIRAERVEYGFGVMRSRPAESVGSARAQNSPNDPIHSCTTTP
jgi:hypothetical protein